MYYVSRGASIEDWHVMSRGIPGRWDVVTRRGSEGAGLRLRCWIDQRTMMMVSSCANDALHFRTQLPVVSSHARVCLVLLQCHNSFYPHTK